jgi:NAD(P)-dependent dehydrogenase (short-subunit alcohol dehydrogenase family)
MKGRKFIITGGANGIGRAITTAVVAQGDSAIVIDTDCAAGNALAASLAPGQIMFYPGDIGRRQDLEAFVQAAVQAAGPIGALINNACYLAGGLNTCGYEDFDRVLKVGLIAPFYLSKLLMPHFAPGASIVNIASTRAFMSQPDTESYSAAKGGIIALTHAMSATLAGRVRVNSISPGWIDTGASSPSDGPLARHSAADRAQHPAGRVGAPEDIARMALYLCSDDAGFIAGENIVIDGGMSRLMIYHDDFGWKLQPPG